MHPFQDDHLIRVKLDHITGFALTGSEIVVGHPNSLSCN
jgi:hypothetical protein